MEYFQKAISTLPHAPGVYLFKDEQGSVLYVGKAKDLKKRVSHYATREAIGEKTKALVMEATHLEIVETASEFDALLLEADRIRQYQPKYNVILKDDKSPLYVLLTLSEELPHVYTIRRTDIPKHSNKGDALFGPFQSARVLRSLLRHIRYSIPYCTQKRRTTKPCFYTHLGLCSPCPSAIMTLPVAQKKSLIHQYRVNIFRLKNIFSGKSSDVVGDMEKDMKEQAAGNRFEEAAVTKQHIFNLYRILQTSYDPMRYMESDAAVEDILTLELSELQAILAPHIPSVSELHRIECVDIANTQGQYATGSIVVLTDGKKDTSQYRRFRIRRKNLPNDVAMIAEVVARRLSHPEWPYPDLLVVDGGKGQVKAAQQALSLTIPIIGLAKRFEELVIPKENGWKTIRIPLTSPALHVVQRIRDEAHRFANSYHRLLRRRQFDTIVAT
ncbi:hypothetical protein A3A64_00225 [Candidatus Gottesmanbacteria bacterium RIFCSPLOWO2_01_FULL_48_11]|uniref:Excinuclease ABC subunit C n=3 Tax=Candidatus Gottesmaniibacteriota TaxID=1752720 RepID=A0A0G1TZS4_9BACT|nr:MAG: Excinuclease ABC subunit C [Candidatus Gottesmanbacteria bacterium GW2011_GWA2_47_9]OGG28335.1 MAG: hypothetical protein A3A64_00225 [Candidatus Gottesmanbacteria bacterium RIFCSPLOWO2_01_FULL_48_11]